MGGLPNFKNTLNHSRVFICVQYLLRWALIWASTRIFGDKGVEGRRERRGGKRTVLVSFKGPVSGQVWFIDMSPKSSLSPDPYGLSRNPAIRGRPPRSS